MASCQIHGRLYTEIHNAPLWFLWTQITHTPAGDGLMRGESFALIKERIVKLSGVDMAVVDKEAKKLRDAKLEEEMLLGGVDPSKNKSASYYTGTSSLGIPEAEAYRESGYKQYNDL